MADPVQLDLLKRVFSYPDAYAPEQRAQHHREHARTWRDRDRFSGGLLCDNLEVNHIVSQNTELDRFGRLSDIGAIVGPGVGGQPLDQRPADLSLGWHAPLRAGTQAR